MRPISFILNICCILFPCCFSAQTIKGKVVDGVGGTPLFSAVVGELGTTNGTTTDFDGDFSIVVKSLPATLVVSLVGFETLEVTVNAACTDLPTAVALCNQLRAALIANGIAV